MEERYSEILFNGPIPASLFVYCCYFLGTISIIQIVKKGSWCTWDSNPGPQDGRRRQNHGAMAATQIQKYLQNDPTI